MVENRHRAKSNGIETLSPQTHVNVGCLVSESERVYKERRDSQTTYTLTTTHFLICSIRKIIPHTGFVSGRRA